LCHAKNSLIPHKNILINFSSFIEIFSITEIFPNLAGSLPPSPADSGVSDVDSSSSGNGQPICSDEIKARLGLSGTTPNQSQQQQLPPPPPGTFLHPNFYSQAPLRNLWNNRNVSCEYYIFFATPLLFYYCVI